MKPKEIKDKPGMRFHQLIISLITPYSPGQDRKRERWTELMIVSYFQEPPFKRIKETYGGCQYNGPKVAKFLDR